MRAYFGAAAVIAACTAVAMASTALAQESQKAVPRQQPPPNYGPPPYGPPPYGPPPYGYPPPQYGPPQYPPRAYAAPFPPAPTGPPSVVYGWDSDRPPPQGYYLDSDPNGGMIGVGVALLTAGYVTAAIIGAVAAKAEADEGPEESDSTHSDDWIPMFIPIGGPIAAIFTLDTGPGTTGMLIANAVVQIGGVLGIVVGAVDRRYKVVREVAGVDVIPGPGSVALRGAF